MGRHSIKTDILKISLLKCLFLELQISLNELPLSQKGGRGDFQPKKQLSPITPIPKSRKSFNPANHSSDIAPHNKPNHLGGLVVLIVINDCQLRNFRKIPLVFPLFQKGETFKFRPISYMISFLKQLSTEQQTPPDELPLSQKGGRGDFQPKTRLSPITPIPKSSKSFKSFNPANHSSDIVLHNKTQPFGQTCSLNRYKLLTIYLLQIQK
jgi:hypothetical protein